MIYSDDNIHEALEKIAGVRRATRIHASIVRKAKAGKPVSEGLIGASNVQTLKATRRVQRSPSFRATMQGLMNSPAGHETSRKLTPLIRKNLHRDVSGSTPQSRRLVADLARQGDKLQTPAMRGLSRKMALGTKHPSFMKKTAAPKPKLPGSLTKYFLGKKAPSEGFQKSRQAAIERGSKNVPGYTPRAQRMFETWGRPTTAGRKAAAGSGWRKTANVQMIKMYLRQGLSPAAAVKRAYPTWTKARRAALVARLRS